MSQEELYKDGMRVPMHYLNRIDLWNTTKPYNLEYYPKEDFPRNNIDHSPHETLVKSMRSLHPAASLDVEGFEFQRLQTKMKYLDFTNEGTIERVYCKELEQHLKETLGAKCVRALDYQVRRRDTVFPYFGGKLPPRPQPSLMTHVDVSPAAAESIIGDSFKDTASEVLNSRYMIITVWRAFRVPVNDWPLAICDATSVCEDDLVASDVIYPNYVTENRMIHFNESQRWYWLPDHAADEILVFKAVDSDCSGSWPCPHGAFPLPGQDSTRPSRESIDVRLLVTYADIDYPDAEPWSTSDSLNGMPIT